MSEAAKKVTKVIRVNTEIYEPVAKKGSEHEGKEKGRLLISVDSIEEGQNYKQEKIFFPVESLWINPVRGDGVFSCRVICNAKKADKSFSWFIDECLKNDGYTYNITPTHLVSVDRYRSVIRFGAQSSEYFFAQDEEYNSSEIYPTKAEALGKFIERISTGKIAGLDSCNLSLVSDGLMKEIGFTEVPDIFGEAPSMWQGRVSDMVYSLNSGGHYVRNENMKSFTDLLEKELGD